MEAGFTPTWSKLPLQEDEDNKLWISVEDFYMFLKTHCTEDDKRKSIRKANIANEIQNHSSQAKLGNGDTMTNLSLTSLYRYIFHHYDDYKICKTLCDELVISSQQLRQRNNSSGLGATSAVRSIFELYKDVCKTLPGFLNKHVFDTGEESNTSLNKIYRDNFSDTEWKTIKLFEHHFKKFNDIPANSSYEFVVEKKYNFYEMCKSMNKYGAETNSMATKTCMSNLKRKATSDAINGILIETDAKHRPEKLESALTACIQDTFGITNKEIMCLECFKGCKHEKGIHIYLTLDKKEELLMNDIITMFQTLLLREHNIVAQEIIFFKPGTLKFTKDNQPKRFYMREKLIKRHLESDILKVIHFNDECEETTEELLLEGRYCINCFGEFSDSITQPLELQNFDVVKEWKMEIPLPLQIFLEKGFISKRTVPTETKSVYESKVASLYCQVDALLNTLNKKYSGLTQDVNTDELLVNYHNISSVFTITSSCGISLSQRTGDRRLKEKADEELCNYKTYCKKYPLTYQVADESQPSLHEVSLKDCHTILMMDNLVYLTLKSDPKPGEVRTNQICTLPITLKGIAKNSKEVLDWHGTDCDMSPECHCLVRTTLSKDHIQDIFFEHSPSERSAFLQFSKEAVWGVCILWKDMPDICKQPMQLDIEQLDRTMESLKLDESMDKTESNYEQLGVQQNSLQLDSETPQSVLHQQPSSLISDFRTGVNGNVSHREQFRAHEAHGSVFSKNNEIVQLDTWTTQPSLNEHSSKSVSDPKSWVTGSTSYAEQSEAYQMNTNMLMHTSETALETAITHVSCDSNENTSHSEQYRMHQTYGSMLMEKSGICQYNTETKQLSFNDQSCLSDINSVSNDNMSYAGDFGIHEAYESMLMEHNEIAQLGTDTTHLSSSEQANITRMCNPGLTPVASSSGFKSVALHEPNSEDEEELETLLQEVVIETQDRVPVLNEKNGSTAFMQFRTSDLLCRHPPPAAGRDDDINVLRSVLDDIVCKIEPERNERILFAPDYKIAKNLFKLMDQNPKYQIFLPEFPVLHLRKSKITNLISAYRSAGLIHILHFMKDQEIEKDWSKLLSIDNIETATRNIWRLSMALHISFMSKFVNSLKLEDRNNLEQQLESEQIESLDSQWRHKFNTFMEKGCEDNANFAVHADMMTHCDEIVAIAIAERIGGPDGYNLMLASVKSSLAFSFLNGASSYGAFCIRLLFEHSLCAPFHKRMKETLFSQPHNNSSVNFGLDTCREIDHRIAKKCIRQGSSIEAILQKMCTVDEQEHVHRVRKYLLSIRQSEDCETKEEDISSVHQSSDRYLGKKVTATDKLHIYRAVRLIQKQEGIAINPDPTPRNVYHSLEPELSLAILDKETSEIGKYLVMRHIYSTSLVKDFECPPVDSVQGPKELLSRVKRSESTTINRSKIKVKKDKTQAEKEEASRKQKVVRLSKIVDCMSSKMNLCQAVVKADCSKATVNKSTGVKKALRLIIQRCSVAEMQVKNLQKKQTETSEDTVRPDAKQIANPEELMLLNFTEVPSDIAERTHLSIIEFAGVKFKNFAGCGQQYLNYISNGVIKKLLHQFPNLGHVVICEEKYLFTPDDFKFLTRQNRQREKNVTISHLKDDHEIVSDENFSKLSIVGTAKGKQLVSTYLAEHLEDLDVKQNTIIDIDSEWVLTGCTCRAKSACNCHMFSNPVRAIYSESGFQEKHVLENINQSKGEAEMSQIDWLNELKESIEGEDVVVNYVTSADIDTVVIHMFYVSLHWPRNEDGSFKNQVFVWLNKKKPELYNITGIVMLIETYTRKKHSAATIAVALCMGGNDFLPSYHGMTHETLVSTVLNNRRILENFLKFTYTSSGKAVACTVSEDVYLMLLKTLYCPSNLNCDKFTMKEVRQLSIKLPNRSEFRHPQSWMPPESALKNLCILTQCQVDYLMTAGDHSAELPNFVERGCLIKSNDGHVAYNLGNDTYTREKKLLLEIPEDELSAKMKEAKVSKSKTKKRGLLVTPSKMPKSKRKLQMSTPRKNQHD